MFNMHMHIKLQYFLVHELTSIGGADQGAIKALQKRGQITLGVFPKCHKRENKIDLCLITNSGFFQIISFYELSK